MHLHQSSSALSVAVTYPSLYQTPHPRVPGPQLGTGRRVNRCWTPPPRLRNLRINNLKDGCWVLNTCSLKGHGHQLEEGREAEYPKETKKLEPNLKVPEFSGATEELFVNVLWAPRRDLHTVCPQ